MNRYQKKLSKLFAKSDFTQMSDYIIKDTKGELWFDPYVPLYPLLLENIEKDKSVKKLFKDICEFSLIEGKESVFEALSGYENFHFENHISRDLLKSDNLVTKSSHYSIMTQIIENFDTINNANNTLLISSITHAANRVLEHLHFNSLMTIETLFFTTKCSEFIKKTVPTFFKQTSENVEEMFEYIIRQEKEIVEFSLPQNPKETIRNRFKKGKPLYNGSILEIIYEDIPEFLTLHPMFINDIDTFKIILKSMSIHYSKDHIINTYFLENPGNYKKSIFHYLEKNDMKEQIDFFLQYFKKKNIREKNIDYQFSQDYSTVILKIRTDNKIKKYRFNIQYIGNFHFEKNDNTIFITVNNQNIEITKMMFQTPEDFKLFKDKLERFFYSNIDENEEVLSID